MKGLRGTERETLIHCFLYMPWLGTEPTTEACALTRTLTSDLAVPRTIFQPTDPHHPEQHLHDFNEELTGIFLLLYHLWFPLHLLHQLLTYFLTYFLIPIQNLYIYKSLLTQVHFKLINYSYLFSSSHSNLLLNPWTVIHRF